MMSHAEFHRAVGALVGADKWHCTSVDVTTYEGGSMVFEWKAWIYVGDELEAFKGSTPEAALDAIRNPTRLEDIDPVPEGSATK